MQKLLMKLLASIEMRDENKVLIALSLKTDELIIEFVTWLKENYSTDTRIMIDQDIIAGYASKLAKINGITI